jgi:hypothetical protein
MTDQQQHRATPEQWERIEDDSKFWLSLQCLLELRDRIAALEADQFRDATEMVAASAPADSLVERVMWAGGMSLHQSARAVLREIAAAARAKDPNGQNHYVMSWGAFARWLEQEAER